MREEGSDRQVKSVNTRNSGIELLKVISIILIVVTHVVQTLSGTESSYVPFHDYIMDLSHATTNLQQLILSFLWYPGRLGNSLFFVCSAWFLLESKKVNKQKIVFMLTEIWVVSVIILAITLTIRGGNISTKLIFESLFPTTLSNNWYLTCYLLFYPLHPILNNIVYKTEQKTLLRLCIVLLFLYSGINYIGSYTGGFFFPSVLILWISIYFVLGYMKLYLKDAALNRKYNIIMLCLGIVGSCAVIFIPNFLGLRIGFFSDKVLAWVSRYSPFLSMSAIALLNLARQSKFKSSLINYISSVSLLVYIIHENLILRSYYRPLALQYIYDNYGYRHILLWILFLALIIFVSSVLLSSLYKETLQKLVLRLSKRLYVFIKNVYGRFEQLVLKLH